MSREEHGAVSYRRLHATPKVKHRSPQRAGIGALVIPIAVRNGIVAGGVAVAAAALGDRGAGKLFLGVEDQTNKTYNELHELHDGQDRDAHPQPQRSTDISKQISKAVGWQLAILHHAEVLYVEMYKTIENEKCETYSEFFFFFCSSFSL